MLEGTFEGKVVKAQWGNWEDKDTGETRPKFDMVVRVQHGDDFVELTPTLFFSPDYLTDGYDKGKTGCEVSMEKLASMGCEVDIQNIDNNNPKAWPGQLKDQAATVYCKEGEDDKGNPKQICYLNRRSRPAISDEEVDKLWGVLSGKKVTPMREPGADEEDDLPYNDDDKGDGGIF